MKEGKNEISFLKFFLKLRALFIVSPEYNHSFPAKLKFLLDNFYEEYNYKPVGICGVSVGQFGGVRVIEMWRFGLYRVFNDSSKKCCLFFNVQNFEREKENYKNF